MKYSPFEKTVRSLRAKGLLDGDNSLTPAGHDWVRNLIRRLDEKEQANVAKERRRQEAYSDAVRRAFTG